MTARRLSRQRPARRSVLIALATSAAALFARSAEALALKAYRIRDVEGRAVTDGTFRGAWQIVFFGFTTCPDVCPTALATLSLAATRLPRAVPTRSIFVTVDPDRDTPSRIKRYLAAFGGGIVGLRGSSAETRAIAEAYGTRYDVTGTGAATQVRHMGLFYVVTPDGRGVRALRFDLTVDELLAELSRLGVGARHGAY